LWWFFYCFGVVGSHVFVDLNWYLFDYGVEWLCEVEFVELDCAVGGLYNWWASIVVEC
jgi:hypothetical protein